MKIQKKIFYLFGAVIIIGMGVFIIVNLPKTLTESEIATNSAFDLTELEDGSYVGQYVNGLVKAKIEVEVNDHIISDIHILEHDTALGHAAESIINDIIQNQSVEVEVVSGATISSQTILKATEDALAERNE